jgi:predicted MFS family arabinose efflux permease
VQAQLLPRHRATSQTTINAGTSLGLILAAVGAMLAGQAWRQAWFAFAIIAMTATASAVASIDRPGGHVDGPPREPLLHRVSPRLGATALLLGVSSATFWGFAREQFISVASLSTGSGHSAWVALGIGGFAGAATGAATERLGLPPVLAVVWAGFAIGHAWLASGSLPLLSALVALAVIGAGYMSLTGLTILWAVRDHPQQPGAAVATAFLILALGQTVASPIAGALIDQAGLAPAFRAAALVAVLGVLPVLHRPGKRREPGHNDTWTPRGTVTHPRADPAGG